MNRTSLMLFSRREGFSFLEILVSLVVLGVFLTGVFSLIQAGDKMKGRHQVLKYAMVLAENEAESIRAMASVAEPVEDAVSFRTVNGITFEVKRSVIESEEWGFVPVTELQEVELTVKRINDPGPIVRFRLLQGQW
jgi:prepilin-type N-terminal cleavage/methylation domain-containing protein